jgi:hypothetical protein
VTHHIAPKLRQNPIFYKVGHHGSHNATLKSHGVDQMEALKIAIIPVDEKEAKKKHWGRMPLPELIAALENKKPPVTVLRTIKSRSTSRITLRSPRNILKLRL